MHQGNRRLFTAAVTTSAIAVVAAFGTGVAGQRVVRADTSGVAFQSTPADSDIVAHYTVTAEQRSGGTFPAPAGGDSQDNLPDFSPKSFGAPNAARPNNAAPAAPNSNKTVPDSAAAGATPRTTASFIGMQGSNKTCQYFAAGCNPPDMAIAASPDFVLQGVNTSWEVLSPSGKVQAGWPVSAKSFFNVPNVTKAGGSPCDVAHNSAPFLSDPRAIYDATDHRFWAAMLQVAGGLGIAADCPLKTVYYIAVSQTNDPRGSWNVYAFEMSDGQPFAADFTQIGVQRDTITFSANMFGLKGGFYAEIFEANKAQMERGRADFTADGFRNLTATGPGTVIANGGPFLADTVQPVTPLGGDGGGVRAQRQGEGSGGDALFVDTIDGPDLLNGNLCTSAADACKGLALWRISDPIAHDRGGPAPTLTATYLPDTRPFYNPPATNQPSCRACIDGNDLRIPAETFMRNGTIYAAWGTGINNGTRVVDGVVWTQIDLNDGENGPSTTSGNFTLSGDQSATYPALMPEANGDVVMIYEHFSSAIFPEARYTVRKADEANFNSPGRLLKAGEANYRPTLCGTATLPVCRWGDYEATSFDGQGRIWMAGQYTNTHTDPAVAPWFGRNWGTWIGAVGSQDD